MNEIYNKIMTLISINGKLPRVVYYDFESIDEYKLREDVMQLLRDHHFTPTLIFPGCDYEFGRLIVEYPAGRYL